MHRTAEVKKAKKIRVPDNRFAALAPAVVDYTDSRMDQFTWDLGDFGIGEIFLLIQEVQHQSTISYHEFIDVSTLSRSLFAHIEPCVIGKYRLTQPIEVSIETDDDAVIATFVEADISFGGATKDEAIKNLKEYLVELIELYGQFKDSLSSEIQQKYDILHSVLQRAA